VESNLPAHPLSSDPNPAREGPSIAACDEARVGLYVHVPFCARRCEYCDFATGALSGAAVERYLQALELECARRAPMAESVAFTSVFFGGGTPSALSSRHFARVWKTLRDHFALAPGAEVTLEANPETVKPALLEGWATAGVNRLSMGAQSFDPLELERLGRLHGPERPGEALALARAHGFARLSLDLMFGFPGHEASRWERTLETAIALAPEHLSAYCFIPEPDTPLGAATLGGRAALPSAEAQADLYQVLLRRTQAAGYAFYETSNVAQAGAECRHNLVYWLRRDYLALGPSAHGLWNGERYANHRDRDAWAEPLEHGRPCDVRERETEVSRADEVVMLGLRLGRGVDRRDHPEIWSEVERRYGAAFTRAVATGRLERTAGGYRIRSEHRFVADDVIAWVMAMADRTDARAAATASGVGMAVSA
jgi:oxygen-independent coproporphyrinogen-3 oxidase